MIEPGAAHEVGDYCWSARASKAGWLKCEAQAVSRATYAALFAEIGTRYGPGNGTTTFNLPDGKGRALIGAGQGSIAESFAAAAVTTATDLITVASNIDKWITGMLVRATTTGGLPAGLALATDYYVIRISATTIKLATTRANAVAGTAIDITTQGTGTHTLTHTLTTRAVGDKGGEETHASTALELPTHTHSTTQSFYYERGTGGLGSYTAGALIDRDPIITSPTGGNVAHNNMQPYLAENLFIYAGV